MRCRVGTDVCADDLKTLVTAPHLIGYWETGQEVSENIPLLAIVLNRRSSGPFFFYPNEPQSVNPLIETLTRRCLPMWLGRPE
jgi:hypothetical protein